VGWQAGNCESPRQGRRCLCRLAWELSADSFGRRQRLYEPAFGEVMVSGADAHYDKSNALAMVNKLIGV
jgi:hypothetical protein